ncbi:MAG: GNAT family N-acetyltransferase [Candidatus Eremiobacteraeota bacterium]|nr:GNAT family N-acetyltransferase [Candidatus Eremiobacteraeota bacterium]
MSESPHGVTVRPVRPEERTAAAALVERAYAEYATRMAPEAWAGLDEAVRAALAHAGAAEWLVAEQGGVIVGSVFLYPPAIDAYGGLTGRAPWPELRLLAVAPEVRGAGVGRALMDACVAGARAMGADALGLHTSESMTAARALYASMGFVREPAYDFRPNGAELVEAYRLDIGAS